MHRANFNAYGTLIMKSSNFVMIKRLVSIRNSGDKTGFVARLKNQSSAAIGAFSHDETTFPRLTRSGQISMVERLTCLGAPGWTERKPAASYR